MNQLQIVEVTPKKVAKETVFCVRDITNPGFESKQKWFVKRYKERLQTKILKNGNGKMIGFIEFVPAEYAWRPRSKNAPSGYGVFNLLHNRKLLEDHYLSATRFRNILKQSKKIAKTWLPSSISIFQ